jgi:hypothetical protein
MQTDSFDLSLEQEFQMRLMEQSVEGLDREQLSDLLLQTSRLLMVKDNLIRNLMKGEILNLQV